MKSRRLTVTWSILTRSCRLARSSAARERARWRSCSACTRASSRSLQMRTDGDAGHGGQMKWVGIQHVSLWSFDDSFAKQIPWTPKNHYFISQVYTLCIDKPLCWERIAEIWIVLCVHWNEWHNHTELYNYNRFYMLQTIVKGLTKDEVSLSYAIYIWLWILTTQYINNQNCKSKQVITKSTQHIYSNAIDWESPIHRGHSRNKETSKPHIWSYQ